MCFPRYYRAAPKRGIHFMKFIYSREIRTFAFVVLPSRAGIVYTDPVGDTFGVGPVQHDITSLGSMLTSGRNHTNVGQALA